MLDDSDELNARQRKMLSLIEQSLEGRGVPPSLRELASAMGYASAEGARKHLLTLERKGYIERHSDVSRGIRLLRSKSVTNDDRIPVIGSVAAGQPILAQENIDDYLVVGEGWFSARPDFFLKVRGDSMINAGIQNGDLVAIKKTGHAEFGAIIVVRLGEEATLKRLDGTPQRPFLKAENPDYDPIPLHDREWVIEGRYLGLVRRER